MARSLRSSPRSARVMLCGAFANRSWQFSIYRRNPALQTLINVRMNELGQQMCGDSDEKAIFLTLVRKFQAGVESGKCHEDEFQLAAKVSWCESIINLTLS